MGHRALLAVERAPGRYDCYRSQWGAHEWRLARDEGVRPETDPSVHRVAVDCDFECLLAEVLDYQTHEALFVTTDDGVRPFLVCWFGLPGLVETVPTDGAIVGVDPTRPVTDGEFLRGWFRGTKETIRAVVADGALDPKRGRDLLAGRVASWRGERAVHDGPGVGVEREF